MIINNIEKVSTENEYFRQVLFTGKNVQVVLMNLNRGEDIGKETHTDVDQIIVLQSGTVEAQVGEEIKTITDNGVIIVPAGSEHNVMNIGDESVKLWTVYAPPEHPDGTIHKTKAEALEHH